MKEAFKAGTLVQSKHTPRVIGRISNHKKSYDWRIPGYLGEGFYEIIVDGAAMIATEDELELCTLTREEIATRLETLAKMTREGDETTTEMQDAEYALNVLRQLENFTETI